MKASSIELYEDDIKEIMSADRFEKAISIDDTRMSHNTPISIKYDYLDLGATKYNFLQSFTQKDTQEYFSIMKQLSSSTVSQMKDRANELHFRRTDIKGNIYKALQKSLPQAVRSGAILYHFGLYTSSTPANRKSDIRSPRIYFLLGTYGFVYVLFFDPYHELNP